MTLRGWKSAPAKARKEVPELPWKKEDKQCNTLHNLAVAEDWLKALLFRAITGMRFYCTDSLGIFSHQSGRDHT